MKKITILFAVSLLWFAYSCQNDSKKVQSETNSEFSVEQIKELKVLGDSISTIAQKTLMSNVMEAVQKGGFAYAVEFCNAEAIPLTNHAADDFGGTIQRITDKNRNPDNALKTDADRDVFNRFKEQPDMQDSLVFTGNDFLYYKRINLGMETCLNCHGTAETVNPDALEKIQKLYPEDKALGYILNELRGAWKITLPTKAEI